MTENSESLPTVGLIGCGRMGQGLCRNLVRRGYEVLAYDVSAEARLCTAELGARAVDQTSELLAHARLVITCLPDLAAVEAVYRGEGGLLALAAPGTLFVETTSSSPALTRSLAGIAAGRGLGLVDAPLLRGVNEAWNGTVHVLLAGPEELRARCKPVLEAFSERVLEVGELGTGHALKALNNAISMSNAAIIGEVFHLAHQLGVTPAMLLEVVGGGLGGSAMLDLYGPRLASGEHPRTGSIAFGSKDLGLALDLARSSDARTPVLAAAFSLYEGMVRAGAGAESPSRLCDLLNDENQAGKP
jgi:3-hydroxyisobutyrate dehydrogenase-like beta-hydroxyacid dehydrogenase